jgi:hypothetical protein
LNIFPHRQRLYGNPEGCYPDSVWRVSDLHPFLHSCLALAGGSIVNSVPLVSWCVVLWPFVKLLRCHSLQHFLDEVLQGIYQSSWSTGECVVNCQVNYLIDIDRSQCGLAMQQRPRKFHILHHLLTENGGETVNAQFSLEFHHVIDYVASTNFSQILIRLLAPTLSWLEHQL